MRRAGDIFNNEDYSRADTSFAQIFNNTTSFENLIITIVLINSYHSPRYDSTCTNSVINYICHPTGENGWCVSLKKKGV